MTTFTSLTGIMVEVYVDLDSIWCTLLLLTLTIVYIPLNIPCNALVDRFGIKFAMWAGTIPLIIGAWV